MSKSPLTYLDCGSGIAGDMLIGAMIGLGLSPEELNTALHKAIPLTRWKVIARPTVRQLWPAVGIVVQGDRQFGSTDKMQELIASAELPRPVKARAKSILTWLQKAEKHAHRSYPQFKDRGLALLDTLVDVIGSSWGLWRLGINRVRASPVQVGRLSPAAAWIIQKQKIPVYSDPSRYEMATPTGIAILTVIVEEFSGMPMLTLQKSGFGAGQKDIPGKPNVLAIYQGLLKTA